MSNLRCSGVGVVPKKGGKWRMIQHLSAPAGSSINDFISKEDFSLQYASVDDAIRMIIPLGRGVLLSKVDLKSAFRMIPVRAQDWELLGIHWRGQYFVDTCLPFGLRSAPYLFNKYAAALKWILNNNYHIPRLIHYLDDYLIIGPPDHISCSAHLRTFLDVCERLGIPVATDKVEGPTTSLTFLGLELDTVTQELRLPTHKLADLMEELHGWLNRKTTTKRCLLSLIGKLAFAAKAVPAGRLFIRRLITLSTKVRELHHRIHLNKEARADIQWWQSFLPSWNGTAFFIDPNSVNARQMELYTDASGTHGCGAYYQGNWFHHNWQPHQRLSNQISIQWQELFAILAAALTWGHLWRGKKVQFNCDNMSIVHAWTGKTSKQPRIMTLLRQLFLVAANNNFSVSLKHVPGAKNSIADAISRKQFTRLFSLVPQANRRPAATPGILNDI